MGFSRPAIRTDRTGAQGRAENATMAEPYLGEIEAFPLNFAPKGWAFCAGQTLPINQNQALFALLGTTYGGNGTTNFLLPNMQSRAPIHMGNGYTLGETTGTENVALTLAQMPSHSHAISATTTATSSSPDGN